MKKKLRKTILPVWIKAASIGAIIAMIMSVALTALVASLMLRGKVGTSGEGLVFTIRLLSAGVGCLIGASLTDEKILPTIGVAATVYLVLLLAQGIGIFGGSFRKFGAGLLSILIGSAIAGIISIKLKSGKNRSVKIRR